MPRVADHDQRRELIAHAFQRILATEGLASTSFVRVAGEAGVSVGLIQHYFANKQQLLRFVYDDCLRRMGERIDEHIRAGESRGEPISRLMLAGLGELLPTDEQRTAEYRVRQNLLTQSFTDAHLADVAHRAAAELRRRTATAVENGKVCGEVEPAVDSDAAAATIVATASGLADAVALEPGVAVEDVLRPVVGLVFTGRCRHYDT